MPLNLIVDTSDQQQNGLYADWRSNQSVSIGEFFNTDTEIDISIQAVVPSDGGEIPWQSDHLTGDEYILQIGNPDDRPTSGDWYLEFAGFPTIAYLQYDATAAQVKAIIDETSIAAGFTDVTVTKTTTGIYIVDWNGLDVGIPLLTATFARLEPTSEVIIQRTRAGDGTDPEQQVIRLRQAAVASETLTVEASETAPSITQVAANSNVQGAIWTINEGNAVAGLYSVTLTINSIAAKVTLKIGATVEEIGVAFNTHSEINYQRTDAEDNILIERNGRNITITFTGTLSGPSLVRSITDATVANPSVVTTSAAHGYATGDSVIIAGSDTNPTIDGTRSITVISPTTFSVPENVTSGGGAQTNCTVYKTAQPLIASATDVSLIYPVGVEGTIQLNTIALAKQFFQTDEDALDFTLQIKRVRSGGEERIIFSDTVTLKRELINLDTLIPLPTTTAWRSGSVTCSTVDYVDVAFATSMTTADYKIVECVLKYNGAGAAPYKLSVAGVEDITAAGFRCWFSGNATTSYSLEYTVAQ